MTTTKKHGSITVQTQSVMGEGNRQLVVGVEGLAGWHVGIPSTADLKADTIILLRRLADNLERGNP